MNSAIVDILHSEERTKSQVEYLISFFSEMTFFKSIVGDGNQDVLFQVLHFTNYKIIKLFQEVRLEHYLSLEVIFLEGDHSNGKMYIVVTGAVAIAIKKSLNVFEKENEDMITQPPEQKNILNHHVLQLNDYFTQGSKIDVGDIKAVIRYGSYFGEKAIIERGGKRTATVFTTEESYLLVVKREQYLMIKDKIDQERQRIKQIMIQVIPEVEKVSSLQILDQLSYAFNFVSFHKGHKIVTQGETGYYIYNLTFKNQRNFIYILSEGSCEVMKNIDIEIKQRKHNNLEKKIKIEQTQPNYTKFKLASEQVSKKRSKQKKVTVNEPSQQQVTDRSVNHKIVDRVVPIKLTQAQPFELIGCELLFGEFEYNKIQQKFRTQFQALKDSDTLQTSQILQFAKELIQLGEDTNSHSYQYTVKVITQTAKCLIIPVQDFKARFPKESVEGIKINYLMKLFQRFIKIEYQNEKLKETFEEHDRYAWLTPQKDLLGNQNEKSYLLRIYQDCLLKESHLPKPGPVIQRKSLFENIRNKLQLENTRKNSISYIPPLQLPQLTGQDSSAELMSYPSQLSYLDNPNSQQRFSIQPISPQPEQMKQDKSSIQLPQIEQNKINQPDKNYTLPQTFDFGNFQFKNMEVYIKNELKIRGLLKIKSTTSVQKIFGNRASLNLINKVKGFQKEDAETTINQATVIPRQSSLHSIQNPQKNTQNLVNHKYSLSTNLKNKVKILDSLPLVLNGQSTLQININDDSQCQESVKFEIKSPKQDVFKFKQLKFRKL